MDYDTRLEYLKNKLPHLTFLTEHNDGAEDILHRWALNQVDVPTNRMTIVNRFFEHVGNSVLPKCIGELDVLQTDVSFNEPWGFTIRHVLSENEYSALSLEFSYPDNKREIPTLKRVMFCNQTIAIPHGILNTGYRAVLRYIGQYCTFDNEDPILPEQPSTVSSDFPDWYFVPCPTSPKLALENLPDDLETFQIMMTCIRVYSMETYQAIFEGMGKSVGLGTSRFAIYPTLLDVGNIRWTLLWRDITAQWVSCWSNGVSISRPLHSLERGQFITEVTNTCRLEQRFPNARISTRELSEREQTAIHRLSSLGCLGSCSYKYLLG